MALALRDFRLAGVHLPPDQQARFKLVMEELATGEAAFEQNVLDSAAAFRLSVQAPGRLAGLPALVVEAAFEQARTEGQSGWLFCLDQPTYVAVLTHGEDEELRKSIYRAWVTRASEQADYSPAEDNSALMEQLLALRHEMANLVGYPNFGAYALASRMAQSVDEVREFLIELVRCARGPARRELQALEAFAGRALEPWDVAFYGEKCASSSTVSRTSLCVPIFPCPGCWTGYLVWWKNSTDCGLRQCPALPLGKPMWCSIN